MACYILRNGTERNGTKIGTERSKIARGGHSVCIKKKTNDIAYIVVGFAPPSDHYPSLITGSP